MSALQGQETHRWAVAGMLAISAIWGGTFAAMRSLLSAGLSVGTMLALRFTLGALGLWVCMAFLKKKTTRQSWRDGLILGLLLTAIFWLQADGLRFTSTSKSAFITGLYVLSTPLVGTLFFRQPPRRSHAAGALLACVGLFLLVRDPGRPLGGWNFGDSETLLCALLCGFHIVLTGRFSLRSSGWALAFTQLSVVAIASWILTVVVPALPQPDGSTLGGLSGIGKALNQGGVWVGLIYLSLLGTTLAFWLMTTLQKHLGPTEAAVTYSLEPVFAALLAVSGFVPGIKEHLGPVQILGAAIIVGAMMLAELGARLLKDKAA